MSANEPAMLELAIDTVDEETVRAIEEALGDVSPERWPQTREIVTIITIAASTVALINALLDLKAKLSKKGLAPPTIVIRNVERLELALPDATKTSLEALIQPTKA